MRNSGQPIFERDVIMAGFKKITIIFLFIAGFLTSCLLGAAPTVSQNTSAKDVTPAGFAAAAMRHIEKLAGIGCRAAGSPKEAEALEYIETEMKQMGLSPNREGFTFSSYFPEELQLEAGSQRFTPVSVCFDPYTSEATISGPAACVTPPSNPIKFMNLKVADKIAITTVADKSCPKALIRTQFMLALKKPKAIVLLSGDDFNRCRNLVGTATLHTKGRIDTLKSANLMATVPASSQTTKRILVSAHYDCSDGPGAADNASGVALVLEIARYFQQKPQKPGMQLDFTVFGAEECGNLGAKAFLTRHSDVLNQYELVFNIDTLCGNEEKIYIEMRGGVENASPKKGASQIPPNLADKAASDGSATWSWLKPEIMMLMASCVPAWLSDEIKSASDELNCPIMPVIGMGSDHTIFAQAGIPATNIANGGCATHGTGDTPDKINPERLCRAATLVIRILEKTMADRTSKQ